MRTLPQTVPSNSQSKNSTIAKMSGCGFKGTSCKFLFKIVLHRREHEEMIVVTVCA